MYKCTVCGNEYIKKPEFCDCGNDIFDEIIDQTLAKNNIIPEVRTFPVQKLVSLLIFILCLIFAIGIWDIKPSQKSPEKITKSSKPTYIPDIDKIWNSNPPKPETRFQNTITVYEKTNLLSTHIPAELATEKQSKSTGIIKKEQQKKLQTISKPNVSTQKSLKPSLPSPADKKNNVQKKQSEQEVFKPKPKPQPQTSPPQAVQVTKPAQTKPVKMAPTPVKTMDSVQWNNYKNSLRYALLSKLDLVKIIGEGDCAVEFSFDKQGKLLNRRFIYKSTNKSVNDQIYLMLMKLPVYKTPPANYNGETVKIKFYINNGYYEISFIN